MKITNIKVEALYGIHDYNIPLDEYENIKIIHAPNGYGKTTVLKLIAYILNYKLFEIQTIPFKCFMISFDEDIMIKVLKEEGADQKISYIIVQGKQSTTYHVSLELNFHTIETKFPFLKRITQNTWYDIQKDEKINYEDILQEYGAQILIDTELRDILEKIKEQMPVHLISSNRLIYSNGSKRNVTASVSVYAKHLAIQVQKTLKESIALEQQLDTTFPTRLIETITSKTNSEDTTLESIQQKLQELQTQRTNLQELGLLTSQDIQTPLDLTSVDNHTLKMLDLYIRDSKSKLDVFAKLQIKMNLMREIINKRFKYKNLKFNQDTGFVFELPNQTILSPDKLSPGEQNELILIFKLLFKYQPNALILIDEPEISLHIAWQQQLLEDMQTISDLTGIKVIIATHSPDIINGRWDLTTGLEEC